jgi:hypothetical protein
MSERIAAEHRFALHNCGAGPREVFRTAVIGGIERFDLQGAHFAWDLDGRVAGILEESAALDGGIPMSVAASLTAAVLRELGVGVDVRPDPDRDGQTRRLLGVLIETLRRRGELAHLVGIAFHELRTSATSAPAPGSVSALEVARTLAAYAVYAPPLLLWSRSPSLRWMRDDTLIALRRFDTPPVYARSS